jgi:hypothetical protein
MYRRVHKRILLKMNRVKHHAEHPIQQGLEATALGGGLGLGGLYLWGDSE